MPLSQLWSSASLGDNASIFPIVDPSLTLIQKEQMITLLASYCEYFGTGDRPLGSTTTITHRVDTADQLRIHHLPNSAFAREREITQTEIDNMLSKQII